MSDKIRMDSNELDLYYQRYSLQDLKLWIEEQIKLGYTEAEVELSWGYYDDIDSIELVAKK